MTSPDLPELLTESDTVEHVMVNVQDAFRAVTEMYEEMGRPLPEGSCLTADEPLSIDALVARE